MIHKTCKFLVVFAFLVGCKQQTHCLKDIDILINRFYEINYTYPLSLDELLSFYESNQYCIQNKQDSLLVHCLQQGKNSEKIIWMVNDSLFPKSELIVLYETDTLSHHINKWGFPCIGFYNDAYTDCYLMEPGSLEDFLLFCYYCDSIDDSNNGLYDNCNKKTVENLQKCKLIESFQWINREDELLIVIDNDTVWRHNALMPCNEDLKWLFQPHYYDKKGQYVKLEEDANRSFKHNLREIGRPFFVQSAEIHYDTFVYSTTKGIYSFCDNDETDINTKYFKDIEEYCEKFVEEHGLSKIVFVAPAKEKLSE